MSSIALSWLPTSGSVRLAPFVVLVGVLQLANMTALFVGVPDAATIPGSIAVAVWLGGASLYLGRAAGVTESVASTVPRTA